MPPEQQPPTFMDERADEPFTNRLFRETALKLQEHGCSAKPLELLPLLLRVYMAGVAKGSDEGA